MENGLFYLGLYLGLGAMLGAAHLLRCARCSERFETIPERVAYIALASVFEIPLRLWVVIKISFDGCEE
jgi:hypothetical protein